jgi:hypothetical protein
LDRIGREIMSEQVKLTLREIVLLIDASSLAVERIAHLGDPVSQDETNQYTKLIQHFESLLPRG